MEPGSPSVEIKTFDDFRLNDWIVRQCKSIGLKVPTPIQINCIPRILAGDDCIGCAKTGSGKTLAFALPILQKLCEDPYGIFALILTPTRELACQIADQFDIIGKPMNLRRCVVVGGVDMVLQGQALSKRPHIVVATPGRLADHIESCNTFSLKKVKFLVLDEADRLLGGHFDEQLKVIFNEVPASRQTLLFSATITDALQKVKEVAAKKVFMYQCNEKPTTVERLEQFYALCPPGVKDGYLVEILRIFREKSDKGSVLIFTDTCKNCQLLYMTLNEVGLVTVCLHSMMPQRQRIAALSRFRSNTARILIATDVASRGLDIPAVEMVVNHSIPSAPKDYIHRVGRTARAGRGGTAISLVTPRDVRLIQAIEEEIKIKMKEFKVDDREVVKILTEVSVTKREAAIKLDETDFYEKKTTNKKKKLIMEGKDPDEVEEEQKKRRKKMLRKERRNQRSETRDQNGWTVQTVEDGDNKESIDEKYSKEGNG